MLIVVKLRASVWIHALSVVYEAILVSYYRSCNCYMWYRECQVAKELTMHKHLIHMNNLWCIVLIAIGLYSYVYIEATYITNFQLEIIETWGIKSEHVHNIQSFNSLHEPLTATHLEGTYIMCYALQTYSWNWYYYYY